MPKKEIEAVVSNSSKFLVGIIFSGEISHKSKIDLIETKYEIRSSAMLDILIGWEQRGDPIEELAEIGGKKIVVEKFVAFQNLENAKPLQKEGHKLFTNFLFSDTNLPLLSAILSYGQIHSDEEAIRDSSAAMIFLNEALDIIYHNDFNLTEKFEQKKIAATFREMLAAGFEGRSSNLNDFFTLMKMAKIATKECLAKHGVKPIILNPAIPIPKDVHSGPGETLFQALYKKAFLEFESEQGTVFPNDLAEKVSKAKAMVVSMDYNSTWNFAESYANGFLIAITINRISSFVDDFREKYPDKQIYFVMNTGRPGYYLQGVLETLSAIEEMRSFCLAESGGVSLQKGIESGEKTLTLTLLNDEFIPEPTEWQEVLLEIENSFQSQLNPDDEIKSEKKDSSLAFKIAPKNAPSKTWLHDDHHGNKITPDYMKSHLQSFFERKINTTRQQLESVNSKQLVSEKISNQIKIVVAGPDKIQGTKDDMTPNTVSELNTLINRSETSSAIEAKKLERRIKILNYMMAKLVVQFNGTAGYADIIHRDINKYSGVKLVLEKLGIAPNEFVMIHIGDSTSDNLPRNNTGVGDINEGADDVYLVGVNNSSEGFRKSIQKRLPDRGILVPRKSILGLIDMIKGLKRAILS